LHWSLFVQGLPSSQTIPVPAECGVHTGPPLLHAMRPMVHGSLPVRQDMPSTHWTQPPFPLQTWFMPHGVPAAT
jgi:hypothetical protein